MFQYTAIPNRFLETLAQYDGDEVKLFLALCRKTIGFRKCSDWVAWSQIRQLTGLSRDQAVRAAERLGQDGWIRFSGDVSRGYVYSVNPSSTPRSGPGAEEPDGYASATARDTECECENQQPISPCEAMELLQNFRESLGK